MPGTAAVQRRFSGGHNAGFCQLNLRTFNALAEAFMEASAHSLRMADDRASDTPRLTGREPLV
jgi:hypothetical protein